MTETAVRIHCFDFAVEVPAANRSLLETAEMTTAFTTGMFEFLSGDPRARAAVGPACCPTGLFSRRPSWGSTRTPAQRQGCRRACRE